MPWGESRRYFTHESGPPRAGRELDAESGLYFYRARYYDASLGRFINEDPIGFTGGDVNLYAYVFNNPVVRVDPLGREYYDVNGTIASPFGVARNCQSSRLGGSCEIPESRGGD